MAGHPFCVLGLGNGRPVGVLARVVLDEARRRACEKAEPRVVSATVGDPRPKIDRIHRELADS